MIRVGSIVLRVDDLQRQTEFWEAALGYVRRENNPDDCVLLRPRDGVGPNLALDRVRSALQIPPRMHLDLYTEDQRADVKRLLARGKAGKEVGPDFPRGVHKKDAIGSGH